MRTLHLTLAASLLATACDGVSDPALLPTAAPSIAVGTQASGGCLDLDFNADGVLPGSQGMAYFSDPPGLPENASFSVAGGLLTMNTLYGGVVTGYLLDGYDPDLDFTLEFRMRVLPGTDAFGVDFEVSDQATGKDFEFGFTPDGLRLPPPPPERAFLPFDASGGFHTYRVTSPGGTYDYQLSIDGAPVASGTVSGGDPSPGRFIFGDLTGGGNGAAEIDFIHYCQVREIDIDVKPGSLPNRVNPSSAGVLPVAILTTPGLDATLVDPGTVRFGPAGTEASPTHAAHEDADADGDIDAILHFRTRETGITCATASVWLTGETTGGDPIRGIDSVTPVGCG